MSRKDGIHDWVDSSGRIVLLGDAAHPSFVSACNTKRGFIGGMTDKHLCTPSLAAHMGLAWPWKTPSFLAHFSHTSGR